jgi:hypothetical protein
VAVLVVQHQRPVAPQQRAGVGAGGAGIDPAAPHPQARHTPLLAAAAEQHLAGLADQVLLAHELSSGRQWTHRRRSRDRNRSTAFRATRSGRGAPPGTLLLYGRAVGVIQAGVEVVGLGLCG